MTIKGIDVSHYQGNIDFKKVKNAGYEFVFIKATEGKSYLDPMFETNFKNANAAGLYVGAYHFGTFSNVDEAKNEANHFLSAIKGKTFTYPVVLDLEVDKKQVSDKQLTDATIVFLEALENAGYFAMIYSGKSFYENELDVARLTPYATWIARYGSTLGRDAGIWQNSSSGKVPGVSGSCDTDIAYHDYHFISPKPAKVVSQTVINKAPKPVYHKVVAGDTVEELAKKFGSSIAQIKEWNKLDSKYTIFVSNSIRVK
jgi:lysozyme